MRAKTVLNQSLYTDTHFPRAHSNFLFAALQHSKRKNYSMVKKYTGEGHMPPLPPQVTSMGDNTDIPP
jgi:hypothetical protein